MAQIEAMPALATNVFEPGSLGFQCKSVKSTDSSSPPKPLFIVTPTVEGTYPVLLFLPGTQIQNTSYSRMFQLIASHGFIVVAPQLYSCALVPETEEINSAAAVTNWLPTGLPSALPPTIHPNLQLLALSGHSRGGKSAFALALGRSSPATSLPFSALIALDPVAGFCCFRIPPHILTYVPRSFDLTIPVAVIGTGLGPEHKLGILPACAPNGMNSAEFFTECRPPCCYFYAKEFGHMDMLDEVTLTSCMCASGDGKGTGGKDGFRACLAGVFVAFMRAFLEKESGDLRVIVDNPGVAPVTLDPVIFVEE
ncbi:hypothetical protein RHMOL_Rhmol13G0037000 [Rhododendron molle]|uniref:Uncharacterized protein n=1 Tax=Rhododendron molle TaxID=49168 RepID=A0ACC0L343_RHOML|nr:hypothetical protein RHMOL_Rhmol13G0037000 [Rhododendron molle]